jgi:hypothetical protein
LALGLACKDGDLRVEMCEVRVSEQTKENSPESLVRVIGRCRFDLSSEKRLQAGMEQVLRNLGVRFEREKRLNATDIPDFFIEGGIAVECKMKDKAKKMAVYAQVRRYAGHPEVKAIILATNISMGFPEQIEGKPVFLASLSAGWM